MIEFRWKVPPETTTKPPVLQWRIAVAVDASGALCPGNWSEWNDVPTVVVQSEKHWRPSWS